jgi:hypothetical protein
MDYPRRIIKIGEADPTVMSAVRERLRALQFDVRAYGAYDTDLAAHVKLYQIRNVDLFGRNLVPDGQIGPLTWCTLFNVAPETSRKAANGLMKCAIAIARSQVGVREHPRNSNRGPDVEKYLQSVRCPPGKAWCAAFVYWCLQQASEQIGTPNPCAKSAGVMKQWERAGENRIIRVSAKAARADPKLIAPGMIFVIESGGGLGHTGFVAGVRGAMLDTIEGNTDASKTREGGGVYALARKVGEINKGYISYE